MVVVNAGAALVAGARARDFKEGAQLAGHAIDSGAARAKLDALVHVSRELAGDKA
jgi:anthranilate phosphoribosyltransferase